MYEYGTVKSIHDQRMRQYQIEAERHHLLRMLQQSRGNQITFGGRVVRRLQWAMESVAAAIQPKQIAS